jgi:hypothetical protein
MGLHFKVRGGWSTVADPLIDFLRPEVSSHLAQRHDCISVEVHPDHPAPASYVKLVIAASPEARRHHGLASLQKLLWWFLLSCLRASFSTLSSPLILNLISPP